jgi:type II secretory pathway pseudopilin PulG
MVISHGQPEILAKNEMSREGGFTFIGLMFAVAMAGIALAGTGALWQMESRREKEKDLLFIGEEYRRAIGNYYDKSPGATKQFPDKLEDLLQDKRFPNPTRHLRRLYRDPMMPDGEWELIRQQGRIMGVASRSPDKPIKVADFSAEQNDFEGAVSYTEWRFISNGGGQQANANPGGQVGGSQPASQQ